MTFKMQRIKAKSLMRTSLALTLTLIIVSVLVAVPARCPKPPMLVDGYVFIDATIAPAGLTVSARIGVTVVDSDVTDETGYYGYLAISNELYQGQTVRFFVEEIDTDVTRVVTTTPPTHHINLTVTDTEPPSQPTNVVRTSPIDDNTPSFTWDASTDDLGVRGYYVTITGYPTYFIGNVLSWTSGMIADCNRTFNIWATDYADNNSTAATLEFTTDAITPTIVIIAPTTSDPIYTQTPTTIYVSYNYTDLHPKNVTIEVHNATHTIGETTITILAAGTNINRNDPVEINSAVADGGYDVTVTIYDIAGHSATDMQEVAVIVSNQVPVVTITYPTNGAYVRGAAIYINGTVLDADKGANVPLINDTRFTLTFWDGTNFGFENTTGAILDGMIFLRVNFTDLALNTGEDTVWFIVDNTQPIVTITSPTDGSYLKATVWINATVVEANSFGYVIRINGISVHTGTGQVSWQWNTMLYIDGAYIINVTATDAAGNIGSDAITVTVDNTLPVVDITYPAEGQYLDSITTIWINGTVTELNMGSAEPTIDDVRFTLVYWAGGNFAFQNQSFIADAIISVTVSFTDLAGNTGSDSVTFTLDAVYPIIQITYPTEGAYLDSIATIWVNGSVTDLNLGTLEPNINDTRFTLVYWVGGNFAFQNITAIADGVVSVTVSFTDLAGKTGSDSVTFTLDTVYPVVEITYPTDDQYLDSIDTIWVNGTVTELNKGSAEPVINDARFTLTYWVGGNFAFQNITAIADGVVSVTVSFTDLAGKTGSDSVTFAVDTVLPIVDIDFPSDGQYVDSVDTVWVNGTVTELNGGANEPQIDDVVHFTLAYWDGTNFAFQNITAIADGVVSVTVSFTDLAGKTDSATVTFTLDTVAPVVTITYPTEGAYLEDIETIWVNGSVIELNKGSAEPIINDTRFSLDYWDSDTGIFAFKNNTVIADGTITLKVDFTDLAGKTGSDSVTFMIDTVPPVVEITYPSDGQYVDSVDIVWVNGTVTEPNMGSASPIINDTRFTLDYWLNGVFAFKNQSFIADGWISVNINFTDLAGRTGSDSVTFTLDTVYPVVQITYPENGQYLDSIYSIAVSGNVTELNMGFAEPQINDTRFTLAVWDGGTAFVFLNQSSVADGVISVTVSFTDLAGKTGSDSVTFTLDTVYPVVQITYPSNDQYVNSVHPIWINGTVTELNKGSNVPVFNDARFTLAYWVNGVFGFENNTYIGDGLCGGIIWFTDLAGKQSQESVFFTVDTVSPIVYIDYPSNGQYLDSVHIVWVNGSVTELNMGSAQPNIDDARFTLAYWVGGSFAFKNQSAVADGVISVTVSFTDLAGNTGSESVTFTLDTTAPVVEITYPTEGANVIISTTIWVNGTVTELNKDALPTINDTRFTIAEWNPATGAFSFLNNTMIPIGSISVEVSFTDLAGKTGDATVTFSLVAPIPPVLQLERVTAWYWDNDTTINAVAEGDVDSDGLSEIVTGGYYYDGERTVAQLAVWNSTLGLERVTFWYWVGDTTINSIAIGDVDGDGFTEIITGGYYYDGARKVAQLAVWDGATLSLENVVAWYWTGDTCINSVAIKDVTEIVTAGYYNDGARDVAQLAIWNGQTLELEGVTAWYWIDDTQINSVALGDVDGDYLTDIVTGGYYYDGERKVAQLAVWNSTLGLEGVRAWYWTDDTQINSVAVGDVDGDGFTEIVTGGYCTDGVKIAQLATWDGATLSLEDVTAWYWIGDTPINSVAIGDVDDDGSAEIITGGSFHDGISDSAQLVVWNGSDLTLEGVAFWRWIGDNRINSITLGDIDDDGTTEIMTGGSYHDGTRMIAQLAVWIATSG